MNWLKRISRYFKKEDLRQESLDEKSNNILDAETEVNETIHKNAPVTKEHINEYFVDYLVDQLSPKQFISPQCSNVLDEYSQFGGVDAELLSVDLMEGLDFEYWCANALIDMGYSNVDVTPGSGDHGVDIVAEKEGLKYAIQCKRYSSDLGNGPIQEVYAGKTMYCCHVAAVITNRYFTVGAKELASANGVLLWDRDWLIHYIASKQNSDGDVLIKHSPHDSIASSSVVVYDEMLPAAVEVILETGQVSVSILERHLKLGYGRCARLLIEMEELSIVTPFEGRKLRGININRSEWSAVLAGIHSNNPQ